MWRCSLRWLWLFMAYQLQTLHAEPVKRTQVLPSGKARLVSAAVGGDVTCAILEYEKVKCFGRGAYGQLGGRSLENMGDSASTIGSNLLTVDLAFSGVKQVAIGTRHSCSLSFYGQLQCWGQNRSGELGQIDEETQLVRFPFERGIRSTSTGDSFTCVLLTNGEVRCFGNGTYGQLGQGSPLSNGLTGSMTASIPLRKRVVHICSGFRHACAMLGGFTWSVKCWGAGNFGQLGTGSKENVGDDPGEIEGLAAIDFGTGRTIRHVACGGEHTCVLLDNGQVKCFGRNDKGQLGLGDTMDRGTDPSQMGDNLPPVFLGAGRSARFVEAGTDFSCAVLDDNSVKCWGSGADGQLMTGSMANVGDDPGEMASLPSISLGMYTYNVSFVLAGKGGQFGHVCIGVSDKSYHPCDLICWGNGQFGQRGIGNNQSFGGSPGDEFASLPLADLGPPGIPFTSLFSELEGSWPCTGTKDSILRPVCRLVNVSQNGWIEEERIVIFPDGPDSLQPPVVLVKEAYDDEEKDEDFEAEFKTSGILRYRREGDFITPNPTILVSVDPGGGVVLGLSVEGGSWSLHICAPDQAYPGRPRECHTWSFVSSKRWGELPPGAGSKSYQRKQS